ncbi:MAG: hypothetical protein BWK78_06415 [Thiotrichaceae bacterium IS1]|nr:MAG: hypothetical protein BWK78_06415 [Thiotrichaceae bacterium IS1]
MINQRFIHTNDYLFENRLQVVQTQFQALPNREQLLEALQTWWKTAMAASPQHTEYHEITTWLNQQLPAESKPSAYVKEISLPGDFLYAIDNFGTNTNHLNEMVMDVAWYALGTAIGQSLARQPVEINSLMVAWSLTEIPEMGRYALRLELLSTLPEQRNTWLTEISQACQKELSYENLLSRFHKMDQELVKTQFTDWEKTTELSKIWEYSWDSLPFYSPLVEILDLVRLLEETRYLTLLDSFTYPLLVYRVLMTHRRDCDTILSLLKGAAIVLDNDSHWNKRVVALLLTEIVVSHARGLIEAVEYQLRRTSEGESNSNTFQQLRETEIPNWFNEAFGVLLARTDGLVIGVAWLIELVERYQRELWRKRGEVEWSLTATAIESLSKGLADKDYSLTETSPETAKKGLSVWLAAIFIAQKNPNLQTEAQENLWQWFEKLLIDKDQNRDQNIENHFYSDSETLTNRWIPCQPANLLAHLNRPVEKWQQAWERLQEQRRRAMHYHSTKDRSVLAPSQFLIQTGICVLDWLLERQEYPVAGDLWEVLYRALRETWLTQTMDIYNVWPRLISFLFAREPLIFKGQMRDQNIYITELLPRHLEPLWGDTELVERVQENLKSNGLSPEDLGHIIPNYLPELLQPVC